MTFKYIKKIKKVIDNLKKVCYNNNTVRERLQKATYKKIKKGIDKF